jgi:hypothetical protein
MPAARPVSSPQRPIYSRPNISVDSSRPVTPITGKAAIDDLLT